MSKHHVFVSFHHGNDQGYKDTLVAWAEENDVFIDDSVEMGEIPEDWDAQKIRAYIRDYHLKSSTVTILLVGTETQNRKHVQDRGDRSASRDGVRRQVELLKAA